MKKSLINYAAGSLVAFIVVATFVILFSDDSKTEVNKSASSEVSTSTTTTTTIPLPTFTETPETQTIPNPCETISIENVEKVIEDASVRGPFVQSALAPIKACEWTKGDKEFPILNVSIVGSNTFFDGSLESKDRDIVGVGDSAFVVKGVVTGFGGASCGETIIVKKGNNSFAIALCNEKDKKPTDKQLIELATNVVNSLP